MFPMKMLIYSGDFPASSQAALDAAAFRAEFRATLKLEIASLPVDMDVN